MPSRAQRAKQLFEEALERPTVERAAWLESACAGDAALRADVETLLDALREADGFLDTRALPGAGERAGAVIGRYKLLQEIGEGGFGVVWMAEQLEPVRRKVALKIIKLGMDTKQVVARFEAERQALALMDHPGIAKVLDGGATESGRPYFVMELVRGVPITSFCDAGNLTPFERLILLEEVCHAVQHAHHKGVIHRDLKPSNVLVTMHDGKPVPKVIDFGIAKATSQELTQRTLFTGFREIVGTPEYMAPEQAELSGLDVDTRADVYSLGVILYELLTGTKPFELATLGGKGYHELLQQIREVDPPKPSTRVSTLGEQLSAVAKRRRTEPRKLGRLMRGELDWIVMKALDKDRTRRYATARSLADDLRRYRANEPVEAGPPSAAYRLMKLARRNRGAVAAAAFVVMALVVGMVATGLALRRALEAEATSRAAAARARAVVELTQDMLAAADPHAEKGRDYTVRELLADFDRDLPARIAGQADVEAAIRTTIGTAYRSLGLLDDAGRCLDAALAVRRRELGERHPETLETLEEWAWLQHDRGDYEAAAAAMQRVVAAARGEDPAEPREAGDARAGIVRAAGRLSALADFEHHLGRYDDATRRAREAVDEVRAQLGEDDVELAAPLEILALCVKAQGRDGEAEALLRRALERTRAGKGPDHPSVATALSNLASAIGGAGRLEEAEGLHREALALRRRVLGEDHPLIATTLNNLAGTLSDAGRDPEAEALYREALAINERRLPPGHPHIALALGNLGRTLDRLGRHAEAEQLHRRALAMLRDRHGPAHRHVAISLGNLAHAVGGQGRHGEEEQLLREAIAVWRAVLGGPHPDLAQALLNLGYVLAVRGRFGEAEPLQREAVAIVREVLGAGDPRLGAALSSLANALDVQGRHREAAALFEELVAERRNSHGDRHALVAAALEAWARALAGAGDHAAAERALRECIAIRAAADPDGWMRWVAVSQLGGVLTAQQRFAEAEPLLLEAYERMRVPQPHARRKIAAAARLVELYERWNAAEPEGGRAESATRWRGELDSVR